ncbi:Microtubules assembly and stabilization protein [Lithohypha guttulata]|uniref:Microtubules assembly and stabilization protein n=1 Tax=Lithohypha guttulata TaxID=1690604 RepID=A0AAN7T177_9EURO|nr:Microtubules assembly and stabilization protein [Lithohypha guttulata]
MASTTTSSVASEHLPASSSAEGDLNVDWLLHKKDPHSNLKRSASTTSRSNKSETDYKDKLKQPSPASSVHHEDSIDPLQKPYNEPQTNGTIKPQAQLPSINEPKSDPAAVPQHAQTPSAPPKQAPLQKSAPQEESKHSRLSLKKDGRRSSWLSSLGSKLSGSSEKSSRSSSVTSLGSNKTKSPQPSPYIEKSNPFENVKPDQAAALADEQKPVHVGPRRPSVLVAAGSETKLDHTGFLTNALRRLSSGNTATLGKGGATTGAICPRRVLNIDPNRPRTKIADFDQSKLRRVAFKVDVEIAGIAAQADEQDGGKAPNNGPAGFGDESSLSKDTKMAKYKDRSEGAALKKTSDREATDAPESAPPVQAKMEAKEEEKKERVKQDTQEDIKDNADQQADDKDKSATEPTTTRKKEKKKRSEVERKERKEKKRRQAEDNGLIPLELTVDKDSDSDSSGINPTPPGATTPIRRGQPTTDPLRIYKRCCQLRETGALTNVKDQISKPSATLAETLGTVAVIDLTGHEMSLADIQTLGDWLAVVPVRKLVLDDCNLSDEAVRIILSGLTGCKTADQARSNRKLPRRAGKSGIEALGVIERLSMKNNTAISAIGWKHIALFIHLCQSLRAIDLSGIPFPANASSDLSRTSTTSSNLVGSQELPPKRMNLSQLLNRAISERYGDRLEELILSRCDITSQTVSDLVDSIIKCKVKRLGLAENNLNEEAIVHIVRYVMSGICEGLDISGNDLNGTGHLLTEVLDDRNPLFAISVADCNLSVDDLRAMLQHLSLLQNFKFIDLSRNHELFEGPKDVVPLLRRRLPQMKELKRIHLADVGMTPTQLISLAEIFPDCPALGHVSVLDNQRLIECMNSTQADAQEEACAVFVSLMTAVRASKTLVAVEIEVPSQESSEVVKALSSQVVAYSLRNLEHTTLPEIGVHQDKTTPTKLDKQAPEVLLHVVGHMEGYDENHDNDEPAPDEDYMMATNGIVRALGVCLGNKEASRAYSRNISPAASGTVTPRSGAVRPPGARKPKDVSLELCESARKIRLRLRPAMVKEDQAGNNEGYRRLMYLDQTLQRIIKRFEDEYPESRPRQSPSVLSIDSPKSAEADQYGPLSRLTSLDDERADAEHAQESDPYSLSLARTGSHTSLAARAQVEEEGRMHRFGQHFRREVLKPSGTDDALHGTSIDDAPEGASPAALRARFETMNGDAIRAQVEMYGADDVVKELGINLQQLRMLEEEDPEGFARLRDSQLAALFNSGKLDGDGFERGRSSEAHTTNGSMFSALTH